ncbi:MAG: FmdB family transcriptional regulator [Gemmatimonadetes bacterium]|nr:MAG: FmdB family transcriptional regulator [Gemmatimonadota bacterium]
MPTYEYKCPAGHVFEKFYPTMTNSRRVKCPTCGRLAARQISGGAGLVFKGSGFYITDYKRAGEKRESEGDGKPVTESKPASEVKPASDSKPVESAKKKKDSGEK